MEADRQRPGTINDCATARMSANFRNWSKRLIRSEHLEYDSTLGTRSDSVNGILSAYSRPVTPVLTTVFYR